MPYDSVSQLSRAARRILPKQAEQSHRQAFDWAWEMGIGTRLTSGLFVSIVLLGCASVPAIPAGLLTPQTTQRATLISTTTELSRANYRVVRTGLKGESRGLVLLLFFNVVPTSLTEAVDRLYQAGVLEPGASWALANVVVEQEPRSFLLFGLPRIRVRADLLEFRPARELPRRRPAARSSGSDPPAGPP